MRASFLGHGPLTARAGVVATAWAMACAPAALAGPPAAPAKPTPVAPAQPPTALAIDEAIALRQRGQYEQASQKLLAWMAEHPDDARARHELGTLYALNGQLRDAEEQFNQALVRQPGFRAARWNLAETLRADERCGDALPHYARLADDDPSDGPARKGQVLCNAILGRWEPALAACDVLIKRFPGTSLGNWASAQRARIAEMAAGGALTVGQMEAEGKQLFVEKRYADAAVWLAMAAATEPTADRHYRVAMAYLGAQDLMACQAALARAVAADPSHQPARMAMATVARALRTMGKGAVNVAFAAVAEVPERALARALLDGDLVVARQLALAALAGKGEAAPGAVGLLLAGEVELRDGRNTRALELFERAHQLRQGHDGARKAMADAAFQLGRFADARRLASLPAPPPHLPENADLPVFVRQRRAEFNHQLKMMLDPGVRPMAAIADLVAGDLPPPPHKVEPPAPEPPPPAKGKGKGGKAGKKK
ncbi:MAG: tetratricopeptide repeat protein [Deltaproteobacteria bacterium]|nr:tetratricopeptide repeat protein [Deltaproteobacteria bacterium]